MEAHINEINTLQPPNGWKNQPKNRWLQPRAHGNTILKGSQIEVIRYIPPELREDDPESAQFAAWQHAQLDREIEIRKEMKSRISPFKIDVVSLDTGQGGDNGEQGM